MCQRDLLSTAVQLHGKNCNAWEYDDSPALSRFWSWMQVMTVALELWEARSSILPPPGPSSTSELECYWSLSNTNILFLGVTSSSSWMRQMLWPMMPRMLSVGSLKNSLRMSGIRKFVCFTLLRNRITTYLRFCLIGNYLSKIIPALQSRCTRYNILMIIFSKVS